MPLLAGAHRRGRSGNGKLERAFIDDVGRARLGGAALYGMDNVAFMTEVQIDRAFKPKIRRETSELEDDIQGGSRG